VIYFKILSIVDCAFSVDVFFPKEDELRRFKEKELQRSKEDKGIIDVSKIWLKEKRVNVKEAKVLQKKQIREIIADEDFAKEFIKDCGKLQKKRSER
jgi:hypothetical protein